MNKRRVVVLILIALTLILAGSAIYIGSQIDDQTPDDVSTSFNTSSYCDVQNPRNGFPIYIPTTDEDPQCLGTADNKYRVARHWGPATDLNGDGTITDDECLVSNEQPELYYSGPGVNIYAVPPDMYGSEIYCGRCIQIDITVDDPINRDLGINGKFGSAQYGGDCPVPENNPALKITKWVEVDGIVINNPVFKPGDEFIYKIKIRNSGNANFSAVRFRDDLTPLLGKLTFLDGDLAYGRINKTSGEKSWNIPDGGTKTVFSTATYDPNSGASRPLSYINSTNNILTAPNLLDYWAQFGNFRPGENFNISLRFKVKDNATAGSLINEAKADDRGNIIVTDTTPITIQVPVVTTPPIVVTTPPIVVTTPPIVVTTPPVVITTPPVVITSPPPALCGGTCTESAQCPNDHQCVDQGSGLKCVLNQCVADSSSCQSDGCTPITIIDNPNIELIKEEVDIITGNVINDQYNVGDRDIYFRVTITNTGNVPITELTFEDGYDETILRLLSGGIRYNNAIYDINVATQTPGRIYIPDVLGFVGLTELAPGGQLAVILRFEALAVPDGGQTRNVAIVETPSTSDTADDDVTIVAPITTTPPPVFCGQPCTSTSQCENNHQCSGGTCTLNACVINPNLCTVDGCTYIGNEIATPLPGKGTTLPDTALSEDMTRILLGLLLIIGGFIAFRHETVREFLMNYGIDMPDFRQSWEERVETRSDKDNIR